MGFTEAEISGLGALIIIVGVFTSMVAGILLNKYHKYLLMVRISAIGSFVINSVAIYSFSTKNKLLIAINIIIGAMAIIPIIPVGIDFAAELTFPYQETVVTGFILMSAQAFGFFLSIATLQVLLVDPEKPAMGPVYAMGLLIGCAFLASISSLTIKEDLRRIDFTRE